jgi:hypothetical protein
MKIIVKSALAAAAAAGLIFATSGPAAADHISPHAHCLLTPDGYVPIASGLSENAPLDPALDQFHDHVHRGEPGEQQMIRAIPVGADCPPDPSEPAASEQD